MPGDVVWVPILPSLKDFASNLRSGTKGIGTEIGEGISRDVGDGISKSAAAVDKAAEVASKAHTKVADASGKVRVEEQKLAEVREKASTASRGLDDAESKLAALRDSGTASSKQIEAAEKAVETARTKSNSAATGIVTAEERLESARRKATAASDGAKKADDALAAAKGKLATAEGEAARATELSADEMAKLEKESRKAEQASSDLESMQGKLAIGFAAMGAAAVGVVAGLVTIGGGFDDMYDSIRIGTGASGEVFEGLQQSARNVAGAIPAMEGGLEQIGVTMADLNTRLGVTGPGLETLTSQFLQLQNMGVDADINTITGSLTAFGVEAGDQSAAVDDLFRVSQATGLTMTELAQSLEKGGPALREFGFGMQSAAGLAGSLDKAGLDADKTIAGMAKGLGAFVKAGEAPEQAMWRTIGSIDELMAAGKKMEAQDLAMKLLGPKNFAPFLEAIESGKFEFDDMMESIGASEDTILGVASETSDWAEQWQLLKQNAMLAVEPLAAAVFDKLAPALESAGEWLEKIIGFVKENDTAFTALAVVVGGMAVGFGAYTIAMQAWSVATRLAAAAQLMLNGAFSASGVGLIITLVAGLVAGIVYLATQTTFFQDLWAVVWGGIKTAIDAVWGFIKPVWDGMMVGLQWIGDKAMWLYNAAILPAWEGIKFAIGLVWDYISFIFSLWQFAFELAGAVAMWLWDAAIRPAFEFIGGLIQSVWDGILSPVFGFFGAALQKVGDVATWLYENAIKPAWEGIKSAISAVWDFVSPILGKIGEAFSAIGDIAKNVGGAIKTAFDGVVGVLKKPINMIGGLLAKIPDSIMGIPIPGAGTLKGWGESLQNLRTGGVIAGRTAAGQLYGPGTGTSDSLIGINEAGRAVVRVSNGEGIVTDDAMNNGGAPVVAALNAGWVPSAGYLEGMLPGLATGGTISYGDISGPGMTTPIQNDMWDLIRTEFPEAVLVSATRDVQTEGHPDNHNAGRALDLTGPMPAMARWIHQLNATQPVEELIHWPLDGWENLKQGNPLDYGSGTNAGHADHLHWAMADLQPVEPIALPTVAKTPYDDTPGNYGTVPSGATGTASSAASGASSDPTTVEGIAGKIAGDFVTETAGDFLGMFGLDGITLPSPQPEEDKQANLAQNQQSMVAAPAAPAGTSGTAPSAAPVDVDPASALTGHDLYAYRIAEQAKAMGLPREAADIAGATALVEAGNPLKMWANSKLPDSLGFPHDAVGSNGSSVGLFQQQDFAEWGALADRMDPGSSARMFFEHFPSGWESMDPGAVAQAVQRSSLPGRYSEEMAAGRELIEATGVYDSGGMLHPGELALNMSAAREPMAVFNDDQWGTLDDLASERDTSNPVTVEIVDRQFQQIVVALGGPPSGGTNSDPRDGGDSRPVQITIEVSGAGDPGAVARDVVSELEQRMGTYGGGREW